MHKKQNGFTLTELMVVVAVIAILGAIAVPNIMSSLPNYRLKSSAKDLCSNMRKARSMAVKQNRNVAILFNINGKFYTIDGTEQVSLGQSISFGSGNATQSATEPPGTVPSDGVSLAGDNVTFNYQGVSNAGYVYLKNNKGDTYAIGTSTSGRIILKQWIGSAWK